MFGSDMENGPEAEMKSKVTSYEAAVAAPGVNEGEVNQDSSSGGWSGRE